MGCFSEKYSSVWLQVSNIIINILNFKHAKAGVIQYLSDLHPEAFKSDRDIAKIHDEDIVSDPGSDGEASFLNLCACRLGVFEIDS